jgi:uncharacterized protein
MTLLAASEQVRLLAIARASLAHGLREGRALALDPAAEPSALRAPGASFVTLRTPEARLRGCVGSLEPVRTLAEDVAENAFRAGFRDPRFSPVSEYEVEGLHVSVSILGEPEPLRAGSAEELVTQLRHGIDGLILRQGTRRATFLPEVWESIPEPREFVRALERKAGIASWDAPVEAFRYGATTLDGRR